MANVAGATKKSCTAAAIFVAYCVGNVSHGHTLATLIAQVLIRVWQIIGPQLIKTPTIKRHYPELWLGLIIWLVLKIYPLRNC